MATTDAPRGTRSHDWDPLRWYPDTIVQRCREHLRARPRHRRIASVLAALFVLLVFPGLVGAVASAQGYGAAIDGLAWMDVRDSEGIPLSVYQFATDKGGLLEPGKTILWTIISLEFVGYIAIVTTAIWIIGYALSFKWLDSFGNALTGVADALTAQIATQIVLITAATIGAFFVAWFIARGFHAKATMQIVTMLAVAMLGPLYLAEPLAEVLSSHGLLAQGRNLGITIAAGLNGDGDPNPYLLVNTMQQDLADNFGRQPVQVWNFGHVLDPQSTCGAIWSAGLRSGDTDDIKNGMQQCGDFFAHHKSNNPDWGQVGTGLLLLVCSTILLLFAVFLALKVFKAALDTIYHCFMAIFGFAAGGFVYGPTQTFLVRNVVDGFIAGARMTVFTVFLGIYVLFMGNLFDQAKGQVLQVIVIACVVEMVAISQLRQLHDSLEKGNDWVTNRFASAIQGGFLAAPAGGGGGGGGTALGMGVIRAGGGGSGMGRLSALNTINSSPVLAWVAGGVVNPLNPLARARRKNEVTNLLTADQRIDQYEWGHVGRQAWVSKARDRANKAGGIMSALGVANAFDGLGDIKTPEAQLISTIVAAGGTAEMAMAGMRATAALNSALVTNPYGWGPLQKALASARGIENHPIEDLLDASGNVLKGGVGDAVHDAFASKAVVAATNFARHTNINRGPLTAEDQAFVNRVKAHWNSDQTIRQIQPHEWEQASRNARWALAHDAASEHLKVVTEYQQSLNDPVARAAAHDRLLESSGRLANIDHLHPDDGPDPFNQ
ncbi:hypothetical protein [Nocardia donostiensis]|uniref:hypothetical protein n=1 Tax=Nocardia donostiensis TaxID=1538463 RepID=UPI00111569D3|nr:hypothetical protein [Nocardia donostiensis]